MTNLNTARKAAKAGETETVKSMLKEGLRVDHRFVHDWTLLHFAAKGGHAATIEALLASKADLNAMNEVWETPLDVASDPKVVKLLCEKGGKPAVEISLHAAAFRGDLKWVKRHIFAGTYLNRLCDGQLPICLALRRHKVDIVRCLLRNKPDLNKQEEDGETAMHVAAASNSELEIMTSLVRLGADLNTEDHHGDTPLSNAAAVGNMAVVEFLIKHGAQVGRRSSGCAKALSEAVESQHFEIARLLIDQGARASIHQAVTCGHFAAVKKMIQEGVDTNKPSSDWHCSSPLILAIEHDWPEIVELLLDSGADPNLQTKTHFGRDSAFGGDTALHKAVADGSARLVKMLLSFDADPDIQNAQRLSPLEVAKRRDNTHLVHVMEAHIDRKQSEKTLEQLYTVHKIAELLSVEDEFVLNLIKTGKLRQVKLDAETVRIPASSLTRYLAALPK